MIMKNFQRFLPLLAVAGVLVGCGPDNSMTQAEIDKAKSGPQMTDADRAKVAEGMAAGGKAAEDQKAAWAKENADKLAAVNAARAKMGRAPLTQ
jgi:hypothetical protein